MIYRIQRHMDLVRVIPGLSDLIHPVLFQWNRRDFLLWITLVVDYLLGPTDGVMDPLLLVIAVDVPAVDLE